MVGERVQHFEVRGLLGRGGMGVVYEAWDTRLERRVALKFLSNRAGRAALRPLIDEAIAASRLQVPSVVTIHAEYDSPQGPFLVMEYAPRGSLRQRLEQGPLAPDQALGVAAAVTTALVAAHDAGILHCDLKPDNVLIFQDGASKVTDFGLSRPLDSNEPASAASISSVLQEASTLPPDAAWELTTRVTAETRRRPRRGGGTMGYMSPEQMRGELLDGRSDLFALGTLMLEMATGRNPYIEQLREGQLSFRPSPAAAARREQPQFGAAYWRLVERLTAEDPERRPKDAATVLRVLERLQAEATTDAGGVGSDERALFGRDEPSKRLGSALAALIDGRGSAWLIEGRRGMGKTALVEHFRTECGERGAVVLLGSPQGRTAALPYAPFLVAFSSFIDGHAGGVASSVFLEQEIGLAPELARLLLSAAEYPARPMTPLADRMQLRDALRSFVQTLAADRAVVLIVDDLHLADAASAGLWASWARACREVPLLLVGTHDSDHRPADPDDASSTYLERAIARRLRLDALDRLATEQLLQSRLPALPPGHKGFDQVFWRTRGVPAFVVEIARLAERSGSSLAAVEQTLEGVMPESVRAALTLRLERLDREDLQLLRAAAVAGETFAVSLLEASAVVTFSNLDERLRRLEHRHHLIRQDVEGLYRFHEPQVREFVLTSLPPDIQRELHRALATHFMQRRAETPPEVLAHHLLAAGRDAEAGRFLRAAAESALSVFAEEEALRLAELAERALPPGARGDARRRDVHLIRARALKALGRYDEAMALAVQAVRLARNSPSRAALGEALVVLGAMQHVVGDTTRAERTLRQAEDHCSAGRRVAGMARALLHRGHVRYQRGQHAAAAAFYRKAVNKARGGHDPVLTAKCRANLSNVLAAKAEFEAAAEGYLEAIEFHRTCGDRRTSATLEGNLGLVRLRQGRLDEARSLLAESLRVRREIGDRRGVTAMELRLARCALALGDPVTALRHAALAEEIARAVGEPRLACHAGLVTAECALVRGAAARADKRLASLMEESERFGGALAVYALELLTLTCLKKGDLDGAAAQVRKARRKVARIGNPAYQSIVDRKHARVLLARGKPRDALRLFGSPGKRRRRDREDVDGQLERCLLIAAAADAVDGRGAEAHRALADKQTARFEMISNRVAQGIADPVDRKRYLSRWRREKRAIEGLAPA